MHRSIPWLVALMLVIGCAQQTTSPAPRTEAEPTAQPEQPETGKTEAAPIAEPTHAEPAPPATGTTPEPAAPPEPAATPDAATPATTEPDVASQTPPVAETVGVGPYQRLVERYLASETFALNLSAESDAVGAQQHVFRLKRPDKYDVLHEYAERPSTEVVSDGTKTWAVNPNTRVFFELPPVPASARNFGLIPDVFRFAPQIARGEHEWTGRLAGSRVVRAETIDGTVCDVVETEMESPAGTTLVWLSQDTGLPLRVKTVSQRGSITYDVTMFDLDVELPDDFFTLQAVDDDADADRDADEDD